MTGLALEISLGLAIVVGLILLQDRETRGTLGLILGLALVVRVIALIGTTLFLDNPVDSGFSFQDDRNYHRVGEQMVDLYDSGQFVDPETIRYQAAKNQGYYYVSAALYWAFGTNTAVVKIFNILVSILTVYLVYLLGESIWNRTVGVRASLLVACLPDVAFWTALQFKDTVVGFLVVWIIYNLNRLTSGANKLPFAAQAFLGVVLLYTFRAESSMLLVAAFILSTLTVRNVVRGARPAMILTGGIAAIVVGALVYETINRGYFVGAPLLEGLREGATIELATIFLSMLNYYSEDVLNNAGLVSLGFILGITDLWRLPIALLFVILIPFPPWPRGPTIATDILGLATIPWLVIMPLVIIAVIEAWRTHQERARLLLYYLSIDWAVLAIFLFAMNPSRHRIASVPLMMLFASAHWPRQGTPSWWLWILAVCGMSVAALVYLLAG